MKQCKFSPHFNVLIYLLFCGKGSEFQKQSFESVLVNVSFGLPHVCRIRLPSGKTEHNILFGLQNFDVHNTWPIMDTWTWCNA